MNKPIFKILTLLGLSLFATHLHARTLSIGIDLSGSNPLLADPVFAQRAADYAAQEIAALKDGDVLVLRSFGAPAEAKNLRMARITMGRRHRPRVVAQQVRGVIAGLHKLKGQGQMSTNLIGWLERYDFGCDPSSPNEAGRILVITDGLESSAYVDGRRLLDGYAELPEADVDLHGCHLSFYGIGVGWHPHQLKRIRLQWQRWAKQAGAEFIPISP